MIMNEKIQSMIYIVKNMDSQEIKNFFNSFRMNECLVYNFTSYI